MTCKYDLCDEYDGACEDEAGYNDDELFGLGEFSTAVVFKRSYTTVDGRLLWTYDSIGSTDNWSDYKSLLVLRRVSRAGLFSGSRSFLGALYTKGIRLP